MIRQYHQRNLEPDSGDCFATCVAMILDLPQEDVPNFCVVPGDWWSGFLQWLDAHRLTAVDVAIADRPKCISATTRGTPVILTGKSPQGDWLHSVVGLSAGLEGFEYLHDPNPSGNFLDDLKYVTFFVPLRPDQVRKP